MPLYKYPPWDPRYAVDALTRQMEDVYPQLKNGVAEVGTPERKQRQIDELRKEGLGHCIETQTRLRDGFPPGFDCTMEIWLTGKFPDHFVVEEPLIDEYCLVETRLERNITRRLVQGVGVFKEYLSDNSKQSTNPDKKVAMIKSTESNQE